MITEIRTPASRCRFAIGWTDITPPAGIYHRMWGAASHDRATGVHRPLRSTVAVFAPTEPETSAKQVLVSLDHCLLGALEHQQMVARIAEVSGELKETILIVCTHTHAAGLMALDRAGLPGGDLIADYLRSIADRTGELVKSACAQLVPASIVYGQGHCALAAHRDFYDEDRKQFVCGFNPEVRSDSTVLIARVTDASDKPLATVVNYACHPTTLAWANTLVSPDYIGAMREIVERETSVPCLFLQGASGELGPREGYVGDPAVADRNGRELGFAALSALTALPAAGTVFRYTGPVVSGATLGSWAHERISPAEAASQAVWKRDSWLEPLKYRPDLPTIPQVEEALKEHQILEERARTAGDDATAAGHRAMAERKRRMRSRLSQLPPGEAFPLHVTLWRIGNAFWAGVQGESYSLLQRELRQRFPGTPIIVACIAVNWGVAYLPPKELYGTGIYQESVAVAAPGSLEQLIDAIAGRIRSQLQG